MTNDSYLGEVILSSRLNFKKTGFTGNFTAVCAIKLKAGGEE